MPGVNTEDNVILGEKNLVLKKSNSKKGKIYAGIPAKEINTIEKMN